MPPIDIDKSVLTAVVRRAVASPTAKITSWHLTPLSYRIINRITAGLYRLAGTITDSTGTQSWSVVLKVLQHADPDTTTTFNSSDDSTYWNYWCREALVYDSDILIQLPATLAAPQCYAINTPTPHTRWLWLEDIQGQPATTWPLTRWQLAARHIGYWQGHYATTTLPTQPWLSRRWLRAWVPNADTVASDLVGTPHLWQHPLLVSAGASDMADAILQLWNDHQHLLDMVEQMPQTLCHLDVWPPNLFAHQCDDGQDQTVLIDWSQVGVGAFAEDMANLVVDSGWMFWLDHTALAECDQLVWTGYLQGLREAGWSGDERLIRLGYAATAALRFGLLAGLVVRQAHTPEQHSDIEQRYQRSIDAIITQRIAVINHALMLADEAHALLADIA